MHHLPTNAYDQSTLAEALTRSTRPFRLMIGLICSTLLPVFASASESDLAASAKEIFRASCSECHGKTNAIADVHVLNHQDLIAEELIVPGRPEDSRLYQLIASKNDEAMPPPGRPSLTEEEIGTVRRWIAAGAPAYPQDVRIENDPTETTKKSEPSSVAANAKEPSEAAVKQRDRDVLEVILDHVRSVPLEDRVFMRFFSTRHLLRGGATENLIDEHRRGLTKAINHLSYQPGLVAPKPIDNVAGGTVFSVDIRELGWHQQKLVAVDPKPATTSDAEKLTLFDLFLLEYPYAVIPDDDGVNNAIADEFLRYAKQVRPIAFVRADWFCSVALQPPIYHDLMMLPQSIAELEKQLGVDADANLKDGLAFRAGVTTSGISRNNRIVERHPQANGYYWKSHDFSSNTGRANILVDPINVSPAGGEMIFSLPNGMQGYFVSDANGDRLDAAPTSIVVDKFASDRVVRNGIGCIRCHNRGVKDFHDVMRDMLDSLASNPGFNRSRAKRLYPGRYKWSQLISNDRSRFDHANKQIGGDADLREPLIGMTFAYESHPIHARLAAAELGMSDTRDSEGQVIRDAATQLAAVCVAPGFTRLGLTPFASGGVIRRDAWEDNFDVAVRALGLGTPIVPINGLLRRDYIADDLSNNITLRTNKASGQFEPGDKLRISVVNKSDRPVFIDLFGTSAAGIMVRLGESGAKISGGQTFRFPGEEQEAIEIQGGFGKETVTLYASHDPLPTSMIFRGKNITDRVVHQSYVIKANADKFGAPTLESDAANIVRKSLTIETR